ncbi:MAG: ABC transporter ATP-binding protein [Firmicutes bacterium]|nr:ABC transporter ATP-binding protein [Bacillota bacterium]
MSILVKAERISKVYQTGAVTTTALRGINLSVAKGEYLSIMGPSGSGKSTLLSIIGGLCQPTQGVLEVDGFNVYELPTEKLADYRREYIGFVFQQFQLIPYLTALENVMLPLVAAGRTGREQQAAAIEVLEKVGLINKIDRLPSQLSGGEQERVAIARAIVNKPPIILADEPTGALDSQTTEEILELLAQLHAEGQTIIVITHNPLVAARADRVVRIIDGMIAD